MNDALPLTKYHQIYLVLHEQLRDGRFAQGMPTEVVLVMDHYVPEQDEDSQRIVRTARDWARKQHLPHVYDSIGIGHVVVPQKGHIRPGIDTDVAGTRAYMKLGIEGIAPRFPNFCSTWSSRVI